MKCEEFLQQLAGLIESGENALPSTCDIKHLDVCSSCKRVYDEHITLGRMLRSLPKVSAPKSFTAEVMGTLPRREKRSVWQIGLPEAKTVVLWAAVFALIFIPINSLLQQDRPHLSISDTGAVIEVDGRNIVVPAGVNIKGDLKLVNGHLTVLGTVEGSITLVKSVLISGPDSKIGNVYIIDWNLWQQLSYSVSQFTEDIRSYVRGVWR